MSYCINPGCPEPQNGDREQFCRSCGFELLLLGQYRPIAPLSQGGFSMTYELDHHGQRKVLKLLNLAQFHDCSTHQKALSLFHQEARVLSQLDRPGIPKVDPGGAFTINHPACQSPLHGLVMEKIEGVNLEQWLKQRGRAIDQHLAHLWLTELTQILHDVHTRQFFHRDIKPSNIMLQPTGKLALIDFGTVREVSDTYLAKMSAGQPGTAIISRGYAPPEQENGWTVPQSDFFALGRTFVYLLTASHPLTFYDAYTSELRWRSAVSHISPPLLDFIDRLMAHLPGQRPANSQEILQQLAVVRLSEPTTATIPTGVSLPQAASMTRDKAFIGHRDCVWSVAIGPGGHILVTGSWDRTIKVWNLATGQLLRTLGHHADAIWSVAMSADGNILVSGSSDNTIKIWHLPTGGLIRTLEGHSSWVAAVAMLSNDQTLVSGSCDKTLKLWHLPTGESIRTLEGHSYGVTSLTIHPDNQTSISGSGDKTIKLWNLHRGELLGTLTGHCAAVTCVRVAPDGKTLVSGDLDKTIKVWDLATGEEKQTLNGHSGTIWALAIAPDGQTLVSGSRDRTLKVWHLPTGKLLATLKGHRAPVTDVAISGDGEIIVSASSDGAVFSWRSPTRSPAPSHALVL
ncbi:serine/threonine-protein kinase [Phormidium sp. CCY1219]|uniref:serine/threonine-protein kinase n=1 Tax=Phormidium sp. CCY1219 TaxID=2886104 RepID=UPI002D1E9414|nr:serine/threonine-protein kinase [Phormidium sp. CCY1219]MEB3827623.1 serine/threonine protein kinase [Phormidium sp. CCY1219]